MSIYMTAVKFKESGEDVPPRLRYCQGLPKKTDGCGSETSFIIFTTNNPSEPYQRVNGSLCDKCARLLHRLIQKK